MDFGNDKTLQFIEDYRSNVVLWQASHPLYKNRERRRRAVKELADKYRLDSRSVLNKIKGLRSYFHREHSKVLKSKRGCSAGEYHKSGWFAYKHLMFILEGDEGISGKETENFDTEVSQHNLVAELNQFESDKSDSSDSDLETKVPEIVMGGKQTASSSPDTAAKKRKTLQLLPPMDECDVFAAHIATQLKNLTAPSCIMAQQDIQAVLTRYRMTDLRLPKFVLNAINGSSGEEQGRTQEVSGS